MSTPITVAYGDGIGPEIMESTLRILMEGGARLDIETIQIGEELYRRGINTGIDDDGWKSINRTKVLLKAPIITPEGSKNKALNVTLRKSLGLYANVRPCQAYYPLIDTKHPDMEVVIIRENEEDIYAGIEYRLTRGFYESIKLISWAGSEKICRYAFEYAIKNGRKKVSCFVKDNVMKLTDGCFAEAFRTVGAGYPQIEQEVVIVDIATAQLAATPAKFDVIVTQNLYGDIISDIVAEISGSVDLAGCANIGEKASMFEGLHGPDPDIADKGIANPSGLIRAAIQMLIHINQPEPATEIHNAFLKTIEDGIHTADIFKEGVSAKQVNTQEFTDAIIENLGQKPVKFKAVDYHKIEAGSKKEDLEPPISITTAPEIRGVDLFVRWDADPESLAEICQPIQTENLKLEIIDFRGLKVWPKEEVTPEVKNGEMYRLRYSSEQEIKYEEIIELISKFPDAEIDISQTNTLNYFYGDKGFSSTQGE